MIAEDDDGNGMGGHNNSNSTVPLQLLPSFFLIVLFKKRAFFTLLPYLTIG